MCNLNLGRSVDWKIINAITFLLLTLFCFQYGDPGRLI
jgi:hypothetical protein